jgi:hypothetical protein
MPRGRAVLPMARERAVVEILREIQPASVRAVCYQLFVRGVIRGMGKSQTNSVSTLLVRMREHGRIPWEWIVDGTRELERAPQWGDVEGFSHVVERSYPAHLWDQGCCEGLGGTGAGKWTLRDLWGEGEIVTCGPPSHDRKGARGVMPFTHSRPRPVQRQP